MEPSARIQADSMETYVPVVDDLPFKMVVLHGYVGLPQGKLLDMYRQKWLEINAVNHQTKV